MGVLTAAPAEKQQLLAEVLRSGGSARLRVTGSSMLPTIWPGDVAILERAPITDLQAADLILFQQDSRLFLHRIVRAEGTQFVTRGDAMPQADPVVHADQILARVKAVEREGKIIHRFALSPWTKIFGLAVAHSDLVGRVALRLNQFGRGKGTTTEASPDVVCEA
jgi:hypothetical protein